MTKQHALLMSTPMVISTLAELKKMTRRIPTCMNSLVDGSRVGGKTWKAYDFQFNDAWLDNGPSPAGNPGPYLHMPSKTHGTVHRIYPLYQPGDILWVRETCSVIQTGHSTVNTQTGGYIPYDPFFVYKADGYETPNEAADFANVSGDSKGWHSESNKWKPSIFMPKEACRIYLEIIGIKVERLQDISEGDAIAEGIEQQEHVFEMMAYPDGRTEKFDPKPRVWQRKDYMKTIDSGTPTFQNFSAKHSFQTLWQSINGPESWEANPWVWGIEFRKTSKP